MKMAKTGYSFLGYSNPQSGWHKKLRNLVQSILFMLVVFISQVVPALAQSNPEKIHPNDVANSVDFKQNIGRDRLITFQKLENLIKPSSAFIGLEPAYEYYIGDYKMSSEDLILLIGEADEKIAPAIWQYNLSQDQRCKVIIGIDADGMVSYIVKKDCL
ncbi:MAG: hypothetical protein SGJ00_15195 [bacterium]|nr:hypothetical protein [bacterium]